MRASYWGVGEGLGGAAVRVELTPTQIASIAQQAVGSGLLALPAEADARRAAAMSAVREIRRMPVTQVSTSLLSGLLVLASLPHDGSTVSNAQLARTLELNPSTCHRYLRTLIAAGAVEQVPESKEYRRAR